MNSQWAEQNLQTIRTLMERAAIYRRALAPVMIYVGGTGLFAGLAADWMTINTEARFTYYWCAVAVAALAGALLIMRRQALRDSEPFWSSPTRRVLQALAPPFFIGALFGLLAVMIPLPRPAWLLMVQWCFSYGCGLHAAGFFMPRGIRLLAWMFIGAGGLLILVQVKGIPFSDRAVNPHLVMGYIFGGLHLAYGIYLYFTEKKPDAA